jgi:ADP-ribosylglycohydrolase
MRQIIRPFDTVGDNYRDQGLGARRPSRLHSIEELPVALGFLALTKGSYSDTVLAATNYGRDADSIAVMGGAIAGALGGVAAVPAEWRREVATRSRLDIETPAIGLAQLAGEIQVNDRKRHAAHNDAFDRLAR